MPHHSLLNNDEAGDVEVFQAVSVQCESCRAESILRAGDDAHEEAYHKAGCNGGSDPSYSSVSVDWAYAFGSEGFAWNEECEHYHFKTEAEALAAAQEALHDELNEAAFARGFDADGREVA